MTNTHTPKIMKLTAPCEKCGRTHYVSYLKESEKSREGAEQFLRTLVINCKGRKPKKLPKKIKQKLNYKTMLVGQYFDHLEDSGIQVTEYDESDGHMIPHIKTEYAIKTDDEMAMELGFDSFEDWKNKQ